MNRNNLLGFWFFGLIYTLATYILLLRDAFLLERFAIALNYPQIETLGLQLNQTLHVNPLSIILTLTSILGLFYFYQKIITTKPDKIRPIHFFLIFVVIATFFLSAPMLSTDIFDYNNINRLRFIHHLDPWTSPASAIDNDPIIFFGSWINRTSVYFPLTHLFFSFVFYLFGFQIIPTIIGFKSLALASYLIILYTASKLVKNPKQLLLLAFNPLILIEFVGNAHNDIIMSIFLLPTIYFIYQKNYLLSGMSISLGILTKVSIALYLPLIGLYLLTSLQISNLTVFTIAATLTFILGLLPLGKTAFTLLSTLSEQTQTYLRSLPTIFRYLYRTLNFPSSETLQKLTTSPIFLAALFPFFKNLRSKPLPDSMVAIMMIYLFISAPMLQPWYIIWFLPLLPILKSHRLKTTTIIFCLSILLHYPILYFSFYLNPTNFIWQIIMYLAIIIPPLVTLILPARWYTHLKKQINYI